VLGHSLGGVVGLALARRPPAWFASRDEAAARYLRISGLAGLADADGPAVDAGLQEQDGRWRLAMDPGAFAVGAPDMPHLLARSRAPVILARGEHDAMNTDEQLTRLGVPAITLPGLGHNAHVENPQLASTLLDLHRYASCTENARTCRA
jgi:pimeloyl-ACP methyl ester carboxylesterase